MTDPLAVAIEGTGKKVFASALEWPGWSRSGKTPEAAIENLLAYAPRYEPVVRAAGLKLGTSFDVDVVEELPGGSGTEFGVPSLPTAADARPAEAAEAARLAAIVEAAWAEFDRVAAGAPAALRKGPRGGGRDRDKMIGHVNESDWFYAREIGLRRPQARFGRSRRRRGTPRRDAGNPPAALGRPLPWRAQVARPLRSPPHRLARPRPRLGNRGPLHVTSPSPKVSRRKWAILLALYALVALAVPFVGYSLPPCFGDLEGHISAECMARWEAAMPMFPQRFVYVLGVPMSTTVTFLALTGMTLVVDVAWRFRRGDGRVTLGVAD